MEFYESKTVKTKRAHFCSFCERLFPVGTEMEYEHGKYDGEFFSRYTCPDCVKYTPGFWEWCDGECGNYRSDFQEYLNENGIKHPAFAEVD